MSTAEQGHSVRPVTMSKQIPADPDTVFAYLADTRNDPEWCPNVTGVRQVSGDGVNVGSSFEFDQTVQLRGRSLQSEVQVEIIEVGERTIRWRVEDRFQIRDILVKVTPEGSGSKVTQTTTARFKREPGLARWFYPMLAKRTLKDQFQRLAAHFS